MNTCLLFSHFWLGKTCWTKIGTVFQISGGVFCSLSLRRSAHSSLSYNQMCTNSNTLFVCYFAWHQLQVWVLLFKKNIHRFTFFNDWRCLFGLQKRVIILLILKLFFFGFGIKKEKILFLNLKKLLYSWRIVICHLTYNLFHSVRHKTI